jgi:hypothetical protein
VKLWQTLHSSNLCILQWHAAQNNNCLLVITHWKWVLRLTCRCWNLPKCLVLLSATTYKTLTVIQLTGS